MGKTTKTITVISNDPKNPKLNLLIKVDLEALLEVKPSVVNFQQISRKEPATQTVAFTGREAVGLKIKSIRLEEDETFGTYEWTIRDQRPQKGDLLLDIRFQPLDGTPSRFKNTLLIETESETNPLIKLPVYGSIQSLLKIVPANFTFQFDDSGMKDRRSFTISHVEKKSFRIDSISSTAPGVIPGPVPGVEAPSYTIMLELDPVALNGIAAAQIIIKTNLSQDSEINIPLHFSRISNQ